MNKKKILIAVAVVVVIAGIYWYLQKQKASKTGLDGISAGNDAFSIDDDKYYKIAKDIIMKADPRALSWANDFIVESYENGGSDTKVKGRSSKTAAIVITMGMMNSNSSGKFKDKDGNPTLWPQSMFDDLWDKALIPFKAKYGGL